MSDDTPDLPFDPSDLPPELRQLFEQLGPAIENLRDAGGLEAIIEQLTGGGNLDLGELLSGMGMGGADLSGLAGAMPGFGGVAGAGASDALAARSPVNWQVAEKFALDIAGRGDREPSDEERAVARRAWELAEHWLDEGELPNPLDAGTLAVASRADWVRAALTAMRPFVEPVAAANTRAMADLAADQFRALGEEGGDGLGIPGMEGLLGMVGGLDASSMADMLRPMGAWMTGVQTGQVIGTLSTQLLGQYDLGIPLGPRDTAFHLAVNVAATFDGYDLDADEVAVALALTEGAHRRLYAAVPWLDAHLQGLVARFANGIEVDAESLATMAQELMQDVDLEDPDSLARAQARAADFRMQPTEQQQRVLERLQTVVALTGAWARAEARRTASQRLPNLGRIEEVLRRRRALAGDGEQMLANLLGLDLRPAEDGVGDLFVAHVEAHAGASALRRTLEHPETLPSPAELADPAAWLARVAADTAEDAGADDELRRLLEGDLGDAPVERSADERLADPDADG